MSYAPKQIEMQLRSLITALISHGLINNQNYPSLRETSGNVVEIDFGESNKSIALKNVNYRELYEELNETKSYACQFLDGAIVQMMYRFRRGELESHRLAFFPNPFLEEYQNNPELYEKDEIYAHLTQKNIVPFPIRFDFDSRENITKDLLHPKSHLTLGQYKNCRIPVSAALMPQTFIHFLVRNFMMKK